MIVRTVAKKAALVVLAASGALPVMQSVAQVQPPGDSSPGLEEVTVTAQRRSERLQDVPLTVTAKSGEELINSGVTDTLSLEVVTPGLKIVRSGAYTQPAIRGVSSASTAPSTDPNVAIYLDGVYQPNQTTNAFDLPDVERIEVLKGPQGTLFGRNATGGAIQIFTLKPAFEQQGRINVGYGRFNAVTTQGFFTAPLADTLAFSVSGAYQSRDGYHHDLLRNGDSTSDFESTMARGKLLWQATDSFSVLLSVMHTQREEPGTFSGIALNGNTVGRATSTVVARDPYDISVNFYPIMKVWNTAGTLQATWDLDFGTFSATSGYSEARAHLGFDADYTPAQFAYFNLIQPDKNFMQEINFSSNTRGPLHYVAGVFYYRDKTGYDPNVGVLTGGFVSATRSHANTKALAGYFDADYAVTDQLTAIAGIRYSWEEKSLAGVAATGVGAVPGAIRPISEHSWDSWTPRVSLRYALTDYSNVYASYNRGFKSGAYNVSGLAPVPVDPEKIDAFEVGLKTGHNGLSASFATFYYRYTNQQVQSQRGTTNVLQNAASSNIYGADVDVSASLTANFKVTGGLSYLKAKYDEFSGATVLVPTGVGGSTNQFRDVSGFPMIRSPEWTANLQLDYTQDLPVGELQLSGTVYYSDEYSFEPSHRIVQDSYALINARASLALQSVPGLSVGVWGRNLSDEQVIQSSFIAGFADGVYYAIPRTYGASIEYKF